MMFTRQMAIAVAAMLLLASCSTDTGESPTDPPTSPAAVPVEDEAGTEVPDVVGLPEDKAVQLLEAAGFKVATTEGLDAEEKEDAGTVLSQSPRAGSSLGSGETVRLVIYSDRTVTADAFVQERIFEDSIDAIRGRLIGDVEDIVESVDLLEYDGDADALVVATTSVYSTDEYVSGDAWEVTRYLAELWSEEFWSDVERTEKWAPAFHLTVNNLTYRCTGEAMTKLADRRLSRSQWESTCRS